MERIRADSQINFLPIIAVDVFSIIASGVASLMACDVSFIIAPGVFSSIASEALVGAAACANTDANNPFNNIIRFGS